MSYRAGVQGLESIGVVPGGPHISCDGCGLVYPIGERGAPAQWFFDGKPPPGWTQTRFVEEPDAPKRHDYCPGCKPPVLPTSANTNPEGQWVDSWFSVRTTQDGDQSTITFHCNVCRGKVSTPVPVADLGKITKQFDREHAACKPTKPKKGKAKS